MNEARYQCKDCKNFYKKAPIINKNCKDVGVKENENICACFEQNK